MLFYKQRTYLTFQSGGAPSVPGCGSQALERFTLRFAAYSNREVCGCQENRLKRKCSFSTPKTVVAYEANEKSVQQLGTKEKNGARVGVGIRTPTDTT
jgi:hypothetical protein